MDGLDGWWLCSFRGKQGIVPANRVTLLAGMYYESALRFSASPDSSISDVCNSLGLQLQSMSQADVVSVFASLY